MMFCRRLLPNIKYFATLRTYSSYNICIIGSGPAGFYTAQRLLKESQRKQIPMNIDMIEKLPTPYGLVRYGVAPDHPEVKQCTEKFENLLTTSNGQVEWFGGISVGEDISFEDICEHYHVVVIAIGAQKERYLNIPGERTMSGIYSGNRWVGWINGHPDHNGKLSQSDQIKLYPGTSVVIGQGNVALDVTRILLLADRNQLAKTDISSEAFRSLSAHNFHHVNIVGRRGPSDISFTAKELREIKNLCQERCIPIYTNHYDVIQNMDLSKCDRPRRRILQILQEMQMEQRSPSIPFNGPALMFSFFLTPSAFIPHLSIDNNQDESRVGAVQFTDTNSPLKYSTSIVTIPCSMAIKCIGYRVALPENISKYFENDFDLSKMNHIPNQAGRVIYKHKPSNGSIYVVGWCKTGPVGVLAAAMADAIETSDTILNDLPPLDHPSSLFGRKWLIDRLGKLSFLTFKDWLKVDRIEKQLGEEYDKSREKITNSQVILDYIASSHKGMTDQDKS